MSKCNVFKNFYLKLEGARFAASWFRMGIVVENQGVLRAPYAASMSMR